MSETKETKGRGKVITNRNSKGEIISYRFRVCVGREEGTRKQIWRTCTIPRPQGLTPRKEEAEVDRLLKEWEKQQRDEFKKSPAVSADKDKITFKRFVEEHWLVDHVRTKDHTPSSIKFFEYTVAEAIEFFGDRKKLIEIDVEDVKRYLNRLKTKENKRGEVFGATSVKHFYGTLKNVLSYAKRLHYIDNNPCDDLLTKEKPHRQKREIDFLKPEQARRFLDCLQTEPIFWQALFTVMLKAGLRRGETAGLEWRDINEKELTLSVVRNATLDKNSEKGIFIGPPKTGEARTLPISKELCALLKRLKAAQEEKFQAVLMPNSFVFCNDCDPFRPIRPDSITTKLRRFTEKNHLPNVSPHDLRHSAASLSLAAGADLKQIQKLLGHADPETTMRFYAEVTEEAQRETADKLEALLNVKNA